MQARTRLDELERLAAAVEREIRRERQRRRAQADAAGGKRKPGRPMLRGEDDHGTDRDYWHCRRRPEGACDLCKAGHALAERRRSARRRREASKAGLAPDQLTIYDALEEATHVVQG